MILDDLLVCRVCKGELDWATNHVVGNATDQPTYRRRQSGSCSNSASAEVAQRPQVLEHGRIGSTDGLG